AGAAVYLRSAGQEPHGRRTALNAICAAAVAGKPRRKVDLGAVGRLPAELLRPARQISQGCPRCLRAPVLLSRGTTRRVIQISEKPRGTRVFILRRSVMAEKDFETSAKELEQLVKSKEEPAKEPDIKSELASVADKALELAKSVVDKTSLSKNVMGGGEEKGEDKPETEKKGKIEAKMEEEEEEMKSHSASETLAKSLADNPEYQEVMEASDALRAMQDAMTKAVGALEKSLGTLRTEVAQIAEMLGTLCKSQVQPHKSFEPQPRTNPMPPFLGTINTSGAQQNGGDVKASREDIAMKLEKAVQDGKLEPSILGFFNTRPVQALATIPEGIAKSYGIPR